MGWLGGVLDPGGEAMINALAAFAEALIVEVVFDFMSLTDGSDSCSCPPIALATVCFPTPKRRLLRVSSMPGPVGRLVFTTAVESETRQGFLDRDDDRRAEWVSRERGEVDMARKDRLHSWLGCLLLRALGE